MLTEKRIGEFLEALGIDEEYLDKFKEVLNTEKSKIMSFVEESHSLMAISPIDGRYCEKTRQFKEIFSEFGLFKFRVIVEIKWLEFLLSNIKISECSSEEMKAILSIAEEFDLESAILIKNIEKTTNHDVVAVVEYIKERLKEIGLEKFSGYVHLFLTSEDVNNTSYSLMLKQTQRIINLKFLEFLELLFHRIHDWKNVVMLGHTHGQAATPTTIGKELLVFYNRLSDELFKIQEWKAKAKWSGATGTFAAHRFAMPEVDWPAKCRYFIEHYLELDYISVSTQINPHHDIAELLQIIVRIAETIVDMSSDMWMYISMNYFKQKPKLTEVGSSTMPHKVNPIDWENARGNSKIAIALCECLSRELLVSTLQRDLSDSTLQRNLGIIFSYTLIAIESCIKAVGKIDINQEKISKDLEDNFEVVTEAIQVILRVLGIPDAYNKLKELSRGKKLSRPILEEFVADLDVPEGSKSRILALKPENYIGFCAEIVSEELNE